MPDSFVDVAHPTGTTRMADDPTRGVVDRNGMVHGIEGLHVAGSSIFPTAGHCNPTQLIVALAIRLADRLKTPQRQVGTPTLAPVQHDAPAAAWVAAACAPADMAFARSSPPSTA
jgi:choline dehydrogenase-like flavoprotein